MLGAGAVGGYFGGRLAAAEADVTFLVRPARAAALKERGLVIESPMGDLRLPVRVATADTLDGIFDTVLLTAKAYDLEQAIATHPAGSRARNGNIAGAQRSAASRPARCRFRSRARPGRGRLHRGDLDRGGDHSPSQPRAWHRIRRALGRSQPPGRGDRREPLPQRRSTHR